MKIWEHKDEEGRTCAIEVPSLAGRRRVARIVAQLPGVETLRRPEWFSGSLQDSFCEFELGGERYEVIEPHGDNSRFLIRKDPFGWSPSFQQVIERFRRAGLWFG